MIRRLKNQARCIAPGFSTPLFALTIRSLQPVILRLALPAISACRCLLVILLPLFCSRSPPPLRLRPSRRPFCAWCDKFTIVCRGTAIAPLHRSAIKSFLGIATEAGVDVQEVEVAAFLGCLALQRMSRNYYYQTYETLYVFYYDLSARYIERDPFLFTVNCNNNNNFESIIIMRLLFVVLLLTVKSCKQIGKNESLSFHQSLLSGLIKEFHRISI